MAVAEMDMAEVPEILLRHLLGAGMTVTLTPVAPAVEPARVEPVAPKPAAVRRKTTAKKEVAPAAVAAELDTTGCRGEVYAALAAGPKTSGELVKQFEKKYHAASIYLALMQLRGAMVVVTREDEKDAQTKNFRVA